MQQLIQELENSLQIKVEERKLLEKQLSSLEKKEKQLEKEIEKSEKGIIVVRKAIQLTEEQISRSIEEICNLALSMFSDYKFRLSFATKRGRIEVNSKLLRGNEEFDPLISVGGGVVDILSVALRIAFWYLAKPRPRGIFILDEPFRHLSSSYIPLAANMLKELSERISIQFIVVTHIEELKEKADKVFHIVKEGEVSIIKEEV